MQLNKLFGRVSLVALCATSLSACADKMYYGSELGQGSGTSNQLSTTGADSAAGFVGPAGASGPTGDTGDTGATGATGATGSTGATGGTGPAGSLFGGNGAVSGGLGVTGSTGVVSYEIGADPVGGLVDGILGTGNGVSQATGTPTGSTTPGFVPTVVADVQNGTTTSPVGNGLGITGSGGLVDDLVDPPDPATQSVGTGGVIPATIAGGQDGLLGNIVGGPNSNPLLPGVGQQASKLPPVSSSSSTPQLGVTGTDGVTQNTLGRDFVGNVIGTQGTVNGSLAGGNSGTVGGSVPTGSLPVTSFDTALNNSLGTAAGTNPSPIAGVLNNNVSTGIGGNLPGASSVLSGLTGSLGSAGNGLGGNVLNNLASSVANVPVVGPVVSGLTNTLGSTGNGAGGNVLNGLTGSVGNVPVIGSIVSGTPAAGNVLGTVTNTVTGTVGTLTNGAGASPLTGLVKGLTGH